uniref:ORF2 n=1 Tax=Zhangye Rhabd tick virus 1 TaxID=2972340 RepID=A0A9E7V2D7_9RHAB|nr:MAG: ORF2 [Zhangye Rhabd tick virus 1]
MSAPEMEGEQKMDLDEVTSKMTMPPESLAEEGKVVTAATKIYSDEMGENDTVGDDKDVQDFWARPVSPDGATDLGSQSDKEVEILKEKLSAPQTPRSRSASRTRKGKDLPEDKQPEPETPKQRTKGPLTAGKSARKGTAPSTQETTTGEKSEKPPMPVPLSEHPLLSKIDIDNDRGFKVTISSKPSDLIVPDPLYVLREATGKSLAQGKDILTHTEAPHTFPVSTAKSWASATALMLATIEKMAKVFKLPDFEVTYNKTKMSFEIVQHPSIRGSSDHPALRTGTPQLVFKQKSTANAATETDLGPAEGPTPAKVSKPADPEPGTTGEDQVMDIDTDPSVGDVPGPSSKENASHPQDLPDASMTIPSLPFELPDPCTVRSAFGGKIDLDILRFVAPGVLKSKLAKWAHFQVYLLTKDPVIRQLCGYMATGNEGVYRAVHADVLMKFIELLEAPSKI